MAITITQTPDMPEGVVRIAASTAPAATEMRVTRLDMGTPRYLDPRQSGASAWGAADVWFRPEATADGALKLGPAITWHLKPHMPYAVSFRAADGKVTEDRMVWKALRLPSTAPPPSTAGGVDLAPTKVPEPETALEDDLADFEEAAAPVTPPRVDPIEPRGGTEETGGNRMWIILAVLILLLLGAGFAAFVTPGFLNDHKAETVAEAPPADPVPEPAPEPAAEPEATPEPAPEPAPAPETKAEAPRPLTLVWAREFLQTKPDAAAAAAEAERFAEAGEDSAAFLIRRYAARQGDAASAVALGDLYAPDTWKSGLIKAPDAAQALDYYERAGELGDRGALEKAIKLVESGQASVPDKAATLAHLNAALEKVKDKP